MSEIGPFDLSSTFLRLRTDASVEPLPVDGTFWQRLGSGQLGTFHHEFLVTYSAFDADWTMWEMHPKGDEVVCLLEGAVTFILERPGGNAAIELNDAGAYVIVPKRTWHTAKARGAARMLFITAGEGTLHRPLEA
jgi:hypothetical protein